MPGWFWAIVRTAHRGTGSEDTHDNFVWASNAAKAWDKLKRMRGFKRDSTPDIKEMTKDGAGKLEEIISASETSLAEAKKRGFYGDRPNDQRTTLEVRRLVEEERARRERKSGGPEI